MAIFMVSKVMDLTRTKIDGIGLVDTVAEIFEVVPINTVIMAMKRGKKISNLGIDERGNLVGLNGSIDRYANLNEESTSIKPLVILGEIVDKNETIGFVVSDYRGNIQKLSYSDTVKLVSKYGIANGKLVYTANGKVYISPIRGSYDKILVNEAREARMAKIRVLFDIVKTFDNKALLVKNSAGKYGVVDANGELILQPIYTGIERLKKDDTYWIQTEQGVGLADYKGNILTSTMYTYIHVITPSNLYIAIKDKKSCLIDRNGRQVTDLIFDKIHVGVEGMYTVVLEGKYGFLREEDLKLIACGYENVRGFKEGRAAVKLNGKWGYIDTDGNEVIKCIYDTCQDFSGGLATVAINNDYGIIDKWGKIILPFKYHNILIRDVYRQSLIQAEEILSGKVKEMRNTHAEVIYMTLQSAISAFSNRLKVAEQKGDITNPDIVRMAANLCTWIISLEKIALDYAVVGINDLVASCSNIHQILLDKDGLFNKLCPKFDDFCDRNQVVYK